MKELWSRTVTRIATIVLLGTVLATSSTTTGAQNSKRAAANGRQVAISELQSIDQLKEAFERDAGKVRLVAILSPT